MSERFEKMTRQTAEVCIDLAEAGARKALEKHGVAVKRHRRAAYDSESGEVTLTLVCTIEGGKGADAVAFERYAEQYELKPEWLGQRFAIVAGKRRGKMMEIIGLRPRATKRPVVCRQVSTGTTFVLPAEAVKAYMEAKPKQKK